MNKVIIVGNLGQDPELRYTQSGTAVANINVATNERRKTGDEWKEHTEWHRVVVWGKTAENCEKYLAKGSKIAVEGRIQTNEWEDKEGATRRTTEIVANNVEFLGGVRQAEGSSKPSPVTNDDDIPF